LGFESSGLKNVGIKVQGLELSGYGFVFMAWGMRFSISSLGSVWGSYDYII